MRHEKKWFFDNVSISGEVDSFSPETVDRLPFPDKPKLLPCHVLYVMMVTPQGSQFSPQVLIFSSEFFDLRPDLIPFVRKTVGLYKPSLTKDGQEPGYYHNWQNYL